MIIGLTGPIASGKTTIAEILKEKGFSYYTYSDILREEAKKRGIEERRENLQKLGTELKKGNPGILSRLILKKGSGDVVADGIRTVDEINELKKGDALIIGVQAGQKIRYQRLQKRGRKGDPKNFETFKIIDDNENEGVTKGQNIKACLQNADVIIDNEKSKDELRKKVSDLVYQKK